MRTKISELEIALQEKTAQYEKDQILWEAKIKFVEQQRDNLKKENSESSKRFESMLDTIQKKSNAEKENIENNAKLTITNMEQKYQKQVKDIQDGHNRLYSELLGHNKELEKELKALRIENENTKNKKQNNSELAKKIEEMNQEKEKYRKIEDALKEEQDKKISEINSNYEKEKNNYKKKIAEIEKSLREAEGKRGALLLESEKEKAKWDIEKDNLYNKVSELNDRITTLEKKNESLLRENERLKNEKNMLRNRGYNKNNDSRYISHLGGGIRSKLGDSSIYKSSMMKVLGDTTDDKSESSDKSSKYINKNIDKKEDVKK
jgi:chromosome segregation ATPase